MCLEGVGGGGERVGWLFNCLGVGGRVVCVLSCGSVLVYGGSEETWLLGSAGAGDVVVVEKG